MAIVDELNSMWLTIKDDLLSSGEVNHTRHDLWFSTIKVNSYNEDENIIVFETTSEFNYKNFAKIYIPILERSFKEYLGYENKIEVIFTGRTTSVEELKQQLKLTNTDNGTRKDNSVITTDYGFQYTFENFIVGSSNKFAHAACTAVAADPASGYNPLFIYGPSGLGKTHLMSAIVNEMKKRDPDARVVYIKGEDFTNEMVDSLSVSRQEMNKFHDKYRNCDILLIDDIQFIAGKASTQEEFFHTFNTLYENHKQIVLSSDRPPKDIQPLEERLRGRFEWGIIADIQPPDLELRIAIIKKKAEQVSLSLLPEVLTFLAENLRSNIRQIEGMIKKLNAIALFEGKEITMEVAASCLQEITGGVIPVQVMVDRIFTAVYNKYGVSKGDIISPKRNKNIAFARHVSIYLVKEICEMSFVGISSVFGRDRTTIMASHETVVRKKNTDPLFNVEISELIKEINNAS